MKPTLPSTTPPDIHIRCTYADRIKLVGNLKFPENTRPDLTIYSGKYQSPSGLTLKIVPAWTSKLEHEFTIGSCKGLCFIERNTIFILAIINTAPHNGQFSDFIQAFQSMAHHLQHDLAIIEFLEPRLEHHLLTKQGFTQLKKFVLYPGYPSFGETVSGVIKSWKIIDKEISATSAPDSQKNIPK